mmetsp:Transcript_15634/g.46348  ORF Transcript_15634/g.46348 Transcript_15634/m.46348 type:complete len:92 (+) Transcript_15634:2389-2664(+)
MQSAPAPQCHCAGTWHRERMEAGHKFAFCGHHDCTPQCDEASILLESVHVTRDLRQSVTKMHALSMAQSSRKADGHSGHLSSSRGRHGSLV